MAAVHVKVRDSHFEEVVFSRNGSGAAKRAYRRSIKRRTRVAADRVEKNDW